MLEFLIEDQFVEKIDRIAVGVSGGADSMLLLWALLDKQKQIKFYLEVINVNHHIRGASSDRDSSFVEAFCKKKKIPYKIVDVDAKKLKADEKYTLEESARIARYDAFRSVMEQDKLNKLFLAHHKNDQAETILMHIFRGAGISGAVGIKNTEKTIRPLLAYSKEDILKMVKDYSIEYVQDESNADNDYSRNYIRNVIFPQLEKVYPAVIDNIVAFGKKCEEVHNFILSNIDMSLIDIKPEYVFVNQKVFELEKFIGREYLKKGFEALGVYSDIESKHIAMIYELSFGEVNKEVSLPHNLIVRKTYDGIKILKKNEQDPDLIEYEFTRNGEIVFGDYCKIITRVVKPDEVEYGKGLYVDATKISTSAVWRTRRIGDRFSKIGTGSKKLNDYFTNLKVDFDLRDKIPILASKENVLLIIGDNVSEKVKIDASTDEIVRINYEML